VKNCSNCGYQYDDSDPFCPACGSSEIESDKTAVEDKSLDETIAVTSSSILQESVSENKDDNKNEPEKKKNKLLIFLIILLIILVLGVVVAGYFVYKDFSRDKEIEKIEKMTDHTEYIAAWKAAGKLDKADEADVKAGITDSAVGYIKDLIYSGEYSEAKKTITENSKVLGDKVDMLTLKLQNKCEHKLDLVKRVDSDCFKDGYEDYICTICEYEQRDIVPMLAHIFEYTVTTEADCTNKGIEDGVCTLCQSENQIIHEALGHDWNEVVTTEATCKEEGLLTKTCKRCAVVETEAIEITENHVFEEKVTKEPTCALEGEKTFTCTVCEHVKTESIPSTGNHVYYDEVTKEPTCVNKGTKAKKCKGCDFIEESSIAATGKHNYVEKITKTAECGGSAGKKEYRCSMCDKYDRSEYYYVYHEWKDATCTVPRTCSNCGETSGSAYGHNWKDATLEAPKTCTRCGLTEGSKLAGVTLITRTSLPITVRTYDKFTDEYECSHVVTGVSYKYASDSWGDYYLTVYFDGYASDYKYDFQKTHAFVPYKIYDSYGNCVVDTYAVAYSSSDGYFYDQDDKIYYKFTPGATYYLEISSVFES